MNEGVTPVVERVPRHVDRFRTMDATFLAQKMM